MVFCFMVFLLQLPGFRMERLGSCTGLTGLTYSCIVCMMKIAEGNIFVMI
jgi:hypothetical protein